MGRIFTCSSPPPLSSSSSCVYQLFTLTLLFTSQTRVRNLSPRLGNESSPFSTGTGTVLPLITCLSSSLSSLDASGAFYSKNFLDPFGILSPNEKINKKIKKNANKAKKKNDVNDRGKKIVGQRVQLS